MLSSKTTKTYRPVCRIFSVLLAVCMIAVLFAPGMTAYAANYNLWVGGKRVTSENASSLLSGRASYNSATNTLTLNGASITDGITVYDSDARAAIYCAGDLNVLLKGSSNVTISGYAIAANGALTISGSGSLTASTSGDYFCSIYSGGAAKINDGTVTLHAEGKESSGLWAYGGLTVSGGTLTASASGNGSCGILCDSAITVNGGDITAEAAGRESWGIASYGKLSLVAGSLAASASGNNSTGIFAPSLELSNGRFSASGNECAVFLDSAKKITVNDGYVLHEGTSSPGSQTKTFTNTASASAGTFLSKPYISASFDTEVIRLGGGSRYETAILISSHGWTTADTVVLVNASSFADALAGVPLAYALDAPILLVNGKSVDDAVMRQISALGAKNAYMLGGELAISAAAAKQLTDSGLKTTRVYGTSRYDTAIAIAKELAKLSGKTSDTVIFANGFNYPDALAVSSAAAITGTPILYAPTSGSLNANTEAYLGSASISKAVVLGGELAIGADVYSNIKANVGSIERVSGTSRYDTAARIIEKYSSVFTGKGIAVATGTNYPDALAGAALAGKQGVAVMLVPAVLKSGSDQANMLRGLIGSNTSPVYVFGGQLAVSDDVLNELLK